MVDKMVEVDKEDLLALMEAAVMHIEDKKNILRLQKDLLDQTSYELVGKKKRLENLPREGKENLKMSLEDEINNLESGKDSITEYIAQLKLYIGKVKKIIDSLKTKIEP